MKSPFRNAFTFSFDSVFNVVGVISGGVSLFNLLQLYFDLGLLQLFRTLLEFYRRIFHRAIDILTGWVHLELPPEAKDLLVLYLLAGFAIARIYNLKRRKSFAGTRVRYLAGMLCATAWPFYLLYVFRAPFFVISPSDEDDMKAGTHELDFARLTDVPGFFLSRASFREVFGKASIWRPHVATNSYAQFPGTGVFYIFDCRIVFLLQIAASLLLVLIFVLLNAGV